MEISLKGKKVVVTGASGGLGRAITETLVKAGASKVYAVDVMKKELDQLASEITNVQAVHLDLSDWSATEATLSKLGPVDCLVNNAAICWKTPIGTIKESDFDKIFDVNVKGLINVTQIISNSMVKAGIKGSIVNLSSISSKKAYPIFLIYSSAKASVDHITHNFAAQLAPNGIRVNAINPFTINTPMLMASIDNEQDAEFSRKGSGLGRFMEPEEVAKVIIFLLSDWSSTISGVNLPVDFGHCL